MKTRRDIFLAVLMVLAIVTLFTFSLTYARYTKETQSDSVISGELDYVVSNEIEINSVNEFFSALENGYSNIKIADSVSNPLVITGSVSDVNSDLTIDLNGHELQRNNREPMLNVKNGVRLTVIDTKGGGSFYNPVGSVLRIDGGTLTVADGVFESGPRDGFRYGTQGEVRFASEYAFASNGVYVTGAGAQSDPTLRSVTFYSTDGAGGYSATPSVQMPAILPKVDLVVEDGEEHRRINGNMYFSSAPSFGSIHATIAADTYLYYTIEGDNVENTDMAATDATANFYYTYYVVHDDADGSAGYAYAADQSEGTHEGRYLVTVYGYRQVKASAPRPEESGSDADPYSAIQMVSGNLYVRGGRYTTYFGGDETYCVQATGGYMSVTQGDFEALGRSVCVGIDYPSISDSEYLHVLHADFYSEVGDTVSVTGGRMDVYGGSFTKDASHSSAKDNGAAIDIAKGELTVSGASWESGRITFDLTGDHMYGVYSEGGSVTCENTEINLSGSYSSGILSQSGTVHIGGSNFACTLTDSGSTLSGSAVSTVGGSVIIDCAAAIETDGFGIVCTVEEGVPATDLKIELKGELNLTARRGTAIYMNGGALLINKQATITSTISDSVLWAGWDSAVAGSKQDKLLRRCSGIFIENGSLTATAALNLTFNGVIYTAEEMNTYYSSNAFNAFLDYKIKSYAVRVDGGNVTIPSGEIVSNVGGGVWVNNGTVTLGTSVGDAPTVTVRATQSDTVFTDKWQGQGDSNVVGNWHYRLNKTGGAAIEVNGGNLTVNGGTYTSAQGDGILVRNLGNDGQTHIYAGTFHGNDNYAFYEDENQFAGPGASYAFKMYGGSAAIEGGSFGVGASGSGAFVMGTSAKEGKLEVTGGTFTVNGQAGFSIYEYADVTFRGAGIQVSGSAAGIAIEGHHTNGAKVTIEGGSYASTGSLTNSDGIWYGNATVGLTITGGTLTGKNRSGLFFEEAPNSGKVQLSGGTYIGGRENYVYQSWGVWYSEERTNGIDSANGVNVAYSSILAAGKGAFGYYKTDGSNGDHNAGGNISIGGNNVSAAGSCSPVWWRTISYWYVRVEIG